MSAVHDLPDTLPFPGLSACAGDRRAGQPLGDQPLAALAHELRGPLVAILHALEAVPEGLGGDAATRRARMIVKRQARRAARIIDDLFDVCAGGRLPLEREVVDVAEVVTGAVESAGHLLDARGHRLTVTLPPGRLPVYADPPRLEQVLTTLLANAATFTDLGGHIRVSAAAEAGQVVLRVRDDGRGIDPDVLPLVFDLFRRGGRPGDHRPAGIGLGLAMVKSLVELHGGTVAAHSGGPGRGAEFVVRLPAIGSGDREPLDRSLKPARPPRKK